jgi:uncharacterized MAPEG superfamily protein
MGKTILEQLSTKTGRLAVRAMNNHFSTHPVYHRRPVVELSGQNTKFTRRLRYLTYLVARIAYVPAYFWFSRGAAPSGSSVFLPRSL